MVYRSIRSRRVRAHHAGADRTGAASGRQTLSARRARWIVGRRPAAAAQRGAAILDARVEPARSAKSAEHLVVHGCDVRRPPRCARGRRAGESEGPAVEDHPREPGQITRGAPMSTRREFLKTATTAALATAVTSRSELFPAVHAAGSD